MNRNLARTFCRSLGENPTSDAGTAFAGKSCSVLSKCCAIPNHTRAGECADTDAPRLSRKDAVFKLCILVDAHGIGPFGDYVRLGQIVVAGECVVMELKVHIGEREIADRAGRFAKKA